MATLGQFKWFQEKCNYFQYSLKTDSNEDIRRPFFSPSYDLYYGFDINL
jgi:hypothetical protein